MCIFDREVAPLETFARFSCFVTPVDKSVHWWRSEHNLRTCLSDLFVDAESEMTSTQVFSLLSDLLTHIRVTGVSLGTFWIIIVSLVPFLLHGGKRLVIGLDSRLSNLNLVHIRGTLLRETIFMSLGGWQFVWLVCTLVRFKLVALLKTHSVIVLAVLGGLLGKF